MVWPIVAAVVAALVQGANQAKTARKQDQNAAAGIRAQAELQRQANVRTDKQLDELEVSTPEDEFETRSSQVRKQMRLQQSTALAGIQNTGGGEAVTALAKDAGGQAIDYGNEINKYLSGIDAPLLQRQGEAFGRADVESSLQSLRRDSSQQDYLTRLRHAGIRDNPWLTLLSTGLSAYAGAAGKGVPKAAGTVTKAAPYINATSGASIPGQLTNRVYDVGFPGLKIGPFGSGSP